MLEIDLILPQVPGILQANGGLRALLPNEEDILYDYGRRVVDYIQAQWPVATGTSYDAWSFSTLADPGAGFGILVENSTDYAEYVHPRGGSANNPLWVGLLQDAWDQYKAAALADLTVAIQGNAPAQVPAAGRRGRQRGNAPPPAPGLQTALNLLRLAGVVP